MGLWGYMGAVFDTSSKAALIFCLNFICREKD
jgi:hypothetical protein